MRVTTHIHIQPKHAMHKNQFRGVCSYLVNFPQSLIFGLGFGVGIGFGAGFEAFTFMVTIFVVDVNPYRCAADAFGVKVTLYPLLLAVGLVEGVVHAKEPYCVEPPVSAESDRALPSSIAAAPGHVIAGAG